MDAIENHAKNVLVSGQVCTTLGLRQTRSADVGRLAATAGIDCLNIDMEHSAMNLATAIDIAVAAQDAGVTPLVRVPGYEHYLASKVLDGGAMGIIFPHVDTPELAAKLVSYCKYPPVGHRSYGGGLPQLNFKGVPQKEALELVNEAIMVIIMLESPQAIENADAIAAVPGVDVITIGSNDLCLEYGLTGEFDHPTIKQAFQRTVDAARKHGIYAGFGGIGSNDLIEEYIKMGMRWTQAGSDFGFIMEGAKASVKRLKSIAL